MPTRKESAGAIFRVWESTRGMAFEPQTPRGKTRLEMLAKGDVFRPGKTAQDRIKPDRRPRVQWAQSREGKARALAGAA